MHSSLLRLLPRVRRRGSFSLLPSGDWQTWVLAAALAGATHAHAAEWSCNFESGEGFVSGQPASANFLRVIGGQATIAGSGGAEGVQFLQFAPQQRENGLAFVLPPDLAGSSSRSIRFAIRLTGEAEQNRLVLSCGQTISLRPSLGGVELEIGERAVRKVSVPWAPGTWLSLEIREEAASQTWSLFVGGLPALSGLPIDEHKENISDVLLFADGMLDLDAISVSTLTPKSTAESQTNALTAHAARAQTAKLDRSDPQWTERYGEAIAQAIRTATKGDLATTEDELSPLCEAKAGSANWHLEMAQLLGMVAHTIHDAGKYRPAMVVALEVLKHTAAADSKFSASENKSTVATAAFLSGRMHEAILADLDEAEKHYHRAVTIDPSCKPAQESEAKIAQRSKVAGKKD